MTRNFGMSGRLETGAHFQPSTYGAIRTHADLPSLPARSIRSEGFSPVMDERTRERGALSRVTVALSLMFVIPLILAGIMLGSR
jgi:hypothetical protein